MNMIRKFNDAFQYEDEHGITVFEKQKFLDECINYKFVNMLYDYCIHLIDNGYEVKIALSFPDTNYTEAADLEKWSKDLEDCYYYEIIYEEEGIRSYHNGGEKVIRYYANAKSGNMFYVLQIGKFVNNSVLRSFNEDDIEIKSLISSINKIIDKIKRKNYVIHGRGMDRHVTNYVELDKIGCCFYTMAIKKGN